MSDTTGLILTFILALIGFGLFGVVAALFMSSYTVLIVSAGAASLAV